MAIENHPAVLKLVNFVKSTKDRGLHVKSSNDNEYEDVPYVSHTALDDFLTIENVRELLGVLSNGDDPVYENLDAGQIKKSYSKVFCLLISIGQGQFINEFVRFGFHDQRLPLPPQRPHNFPHSTSDLQFFDRFYEQQWQFCVSDLHVGYDRQFDPKEILPIRRGKPLGSGGSATAYQIEVHGSYNQLETDSTAQHHAGSSDSHHPPPKTFVLKCYSGNSGVAKYYDNEWRALKRVHSDGPCCHIIGFFGSFKIGGVNNIVLEHADQGTLENYLANPNIHPPCTAKDIITFWESILSITQGLKRIHHTKESETEGPQIFQGWHHDIKPSNILIKSRNQGSMYDFECKLADLGLSHFKRSQFRQAENTDRDPYGTRTYGAPECLRYDSNFDPTSQEVKQNVDVYSLGCVLSVVATWVIRGWHTVLEYRERRRQEIEEKHRCRDGDDFFHNGQDDTLDTVVSHHIELARMLRHCDYVTDSVLKIVDDGMLKSSNSDGRRSAKYLQLEFKKIITKAKDQKRKTRPVSASSRNVSSEDSTWHSREPVMIPPEPPQLNGPLNFNPPSRPPDISNSTCRQPLEHEQGAPWNRKYGKHVRPYLEDAEAGEDKDIVEDNPNQMRSLAVKSKTMPPHSSGGVQSVTPDNPISAKMQFGSPIHRLSTPFGSRRSTNSIHSQAEQKATRDYVATSSSSPAPKDEHIAHYSPQAKEDQVPRSPPGVPPITNRLSLPVWPVEDALNWISDKKDPKKHGPGRIPMQHLLKDLLDGRDQVFLIDNSDSMRAHWAKARSLFQLLGYIVKNYDSNGVDLYLTCPFKKYTNLKKSTDMLEIFDRHEPSNDQHLSDMSARLSEIVGEYQNKLVRERRSLITRLMTRETRKLSLYVFTDAVWQPRCEVAPVIKSLVTTLKEKNLHKQQIGIQFIQFGDSQEYTRRLEELDRLKLSGYVDMDIIDTERANGNVFKMLFGAINDWFDDDIPLGEVVASSKLP